jgi:hypothetical protein
MLLLIFFPVVNVAAYCGTSQSRSSFDPSDYDTEDDAEQRRTSRDDQRITPESADGSQHGDSGNWLSPATSVPISLAAATAGAACARRK